MASPCEQARETAARVRALLPRRAMRQMLARHAGMSVVEASVILTVLSLLTSAIAPVVRHTSDQARLARATSDLVGLHRAVEDFAESTGFTKFTADGRPDGPRVDLLVGAGERPDRPRAPEWSLEGGDGRVDLLDHHLIRNTPGGDVRHAYRAPSSPTSLGWRGAYLVGSVSPDPWGGRYMVNVRFMVQDEARAPGYDVFVYSAGPDGRGDTPFAIDGAVPSGDDLLLVVFKHPLATSPR